MARVSYTSLVDWLKALQVFFVNLLMLVLYLIYRLVLKLRVFASKGMIRLSCRVSSVTLTYRVVQFVTLLLSFLTRSRVPSCTNYSKISLTREKDWLRCRYTSWRHQRASASRNNTCSYGAFYESYVWCSGPPSCRAKERA